MNNCMLVGRLAQDPELSYTKKGTAVTNFTLAVNRGYDGKKVDWINIVAWKKKAEAAAKYLKKGRQCVVRGPLQIEKNQKNGTTFYNAKIVAQEITFLTFPKGTDDGEFRPQANHVEDQDFDVPY